MHSMPSRPKAAHKPWFILLLQLCLQKRIRNLTWSVLVKRQLLRPKLKSHKQLGKCHTKIQCQVCFFFALQIEKARKLTCLVVLLRSLASCADSHSAPRTTQQQSDADAAEFILFTLFHFHTTTRCNFVSNSDWFVFCL